MPKISVIVPVYNVEEEISKCLLSILLQKFTDFEIIAVDDGSTDGSAKILDELQRKHAAQLKVFHTKNHGLSAARNFGIKKASGEYIAFVDSDDYVDPSFLSELIKSAQEDDADIVISGYTVFCGEKMTDFVPKKAVISGRDATIRFFTRQDNIEILSWNKLYKKSLFRGISFPVGKICEDNFTTYKLLYRAERVSYIPFSLYNYIKRSASISGKLKNLKRLKLRAEALKSAPNYFKKDSELQSAVLEADLLCDFRFIDQAISKKISRKYYNAYREKILKNKKKYLKNIFIDKKRRSYIFSISVFGGFFYKIFRRFRHRD